MQRLGGLEYAVQVTLRKHRRRKDTLGVTREGVPSGRITVQTRTRRWISV